MKRLSSFLLLALLSLTGTYAQSGSGFIGDGYYRICNSGSSRYIYVTDNKDESDIIRMAGDFQAIQLWKEQDRTVPDPSTVIYIDEVSSGLFDLTGQGTGIHSLTGYYVSVKKAVDGTYSVSVSRSGVTKYLTDNETSSSAQGMMGTNGTGKYRYWKVDKMTTDHATNYFGVKPTLAADGKFYQPFYAAFPFRAVSPDMHIYVIDGVVAGNVASMKEITGDVPASTPVIIECASENPSDNRLELLSPTSAIAPVGSNLLGGVYFCNGKRPESSKDAYTKFDPATMRVLSVVNGNLVLTNDAPERLNELKVVDWTTYMQVKVKCLPANTSYFKAGVDTPDVLLLSSDADGIAEIRSEQKQASAEGVYSISGTRLRATSDLQGLPAGVYIVNGKKTAIQ